jgi:hypothetical protein
MLRRIYGPKRDEVAGGRRKCTVRSPIILPFTKYYEVDQIKGDRMGGAGIGRCEMRTTFWSDNL